MNNTILTGLPNFPTSPTSPTLPSSSEGDGGDGFGSVLHQAINKVGELSDASDQQVGQMLQGNQQDIHSVMIAVEKADVAFQLMMQVRNKIVNAYQEVSRLQF